jgi:multiple sugar transport system substrate-binding protein
MNRSVLCSALLACMLVGALGSDVFARPAAAPQVKLTVAGWGPGEKQFQPVWNQIKDAYQQANPDVEIDLVGIAYENLRTQLIVQASGGTAPDIAQVDSLIDLELAALGAAAPLDELLSPAFRNDIVPSLIENSTYNGHIYAIPQSPVPHILWMNTNLAARAGLDPSKPITTLDDFQATAQAISALGTDDQGNRIWGFCNSTGGLPLFAGLQMFPIFATFGNNYLDANGQSALTAPEAVEAGNWIQNMTQSGVLGPVGVDIRENRNLFAKEQCGFQVDNTGARGIYRDLSGMGEAFDSHWKLVPWPGRNGQPGVGVYYAHSFVVFQESQHKQEAVKFIQWLLTDQAINAKYFDATGAHPPTQSLLAGYTDGYSQAIKTQMQSWRRIAPAYPGKINELLGFVGVAINSIANGSDVTTSLSDADKNVKLLLGQ